MSNLVVYPKGVLEKKTAFIFISFARSSCIWDEERAENASIETIGGAAITFLLARRPKKAAGMPQSSREHRYSLTMVAMQHFVSS